MSEPRNLTLERVNRLSQAVADLMENHAAQGRMLTRLLGRMDERLASIDTTLTALAQDVRALANEQLLLGNRIEDAFARALRANARLDEFEDK
jgi:ABC-type transporter Mla subunit MlaD